MSIRFLNMVSSLSVYNAPAIAGEVRATVIELRQGNASTPTCKILLIDGGDPGPSF
jgi:hypothetical protein